MSRTYYGYTCRGATLYENQRGFRQLRFICPSGQRRRGTEVWDFKGKGRHC